MSLQLYAHPFSAYCQKVLITLYENATPFQWRRLGDAANDAELAALWPFKRFPVLVDEGHAVMESSIIIEHLDLHHPGPVRMIPDDPKTALDVRMMDRFFDQYIATPMQKVVFDSLRAPEHRNAQDVTDATAQLDIAYRWLDGVMTHRQWAAGTGFSLADCAAAPALFYSDWVHPIDETFANLRDYRARLLARPSFARAVDEARPYRAFFPLGAPDRD